METGACLDWATSCLSPVIYCGGGNAIGVLVENCVTCCVMESMCGRFQLSDRRKAPYLWSQRFDALNVAPATCVGSQGIQVGGGGTV